MYNQITIDNVVFEIEYKKIEPEYEGAFLRYAGDVEIFAIEVNGTDVYDLLLNNAPQLLENIKEQLMN